MDQCRSYTERDVACLPPRWRVLLTGIKAGLKITPLLEAIQILYEDIPPLRMGGDFIVKQLELKVCQAKQEINQQIPDQDVVAGRALFDTIDSDGDGSISDTELAAFREEVEANPLLGGWHDPSHKAHDSIQHAVLDIMEELDKDGDNHINFPEFLAGASRLLSVDNTGPLTSEQTKTILNAILPSHLLKTGPGFAGQHDERFDEIVQFILALEQQRLAKESNDRLEIVLQGSFAAAKDPEVLAALRFVFNEIKLIRIAGEMIFVIVRRFVR